MAVIGLLFGLVLPYPAGSQTNPLGAISDGVRQLVTRITPAVVQIDAVGIGAAQSSSIRLEANRSTGSGVLVDPEGYIVTNAHVVGSARRVRVMLPQKPAAGQFQSVVKPSGRAAAAEVLGLDRETDIAVLKVAGSGLPHLRFADSEAIRQGDFVFAAGSPFGLDNSISMGVVSSVARQIRPDDPMIYIQTDASINPGNSGGPLLDAAGNIAGINTFILSQSGGNEGVGFAVPGNIVRAVYEQIRKFGRVRRGQIGVVAQSITPPLAAALGLKQDWGVVLGDVGSSSAAEAAGLQIRDVILTLNGKPMENARQFGVNIYQHAGEIVTMELLRGDQKLEKKVAVLERPRDPDRILSLLDGERNTIPRLGILAVELDAKVAPMLPPLRRLSGVVVAGLAPARRARRTSSPAM
ncbi:MAG: trypsin-like peptidase domain-containing protein [Bryobacteraceae bacterium]|nr:trypsin-like peptidase domain-containing protein [Bryobacteraceae bacterium]